MLILLNPFVVAVAIYRKLYIQHVLYKFAMTTKTEKKMIANFYMDIDCCPDYDKNKSPILRARELIAELQK